MKGPRMFPLISRCLSRDSNEVFMYLVRVLAFMCMRYGMVNKQEERKNKKKKKEKRSI